MSNKHRCIITPTFEGHFSYINNLITSYEECVLDYKNFDYIIITSNTKETELLKKQISYSKRKEWLKIYDIESILKLFDINISSEELLKKVGKFSYQTIKKMYAMKFLNYENFLIIDSESIFLDKVCLDDIFSTFLKNKYLFYSSMDYHNMKEYINWLDYKTTQNCSYLLHSNFENKWFFETFDWIYEKHIIQDLFDYFQNNMYQHIVDFVENKNNDWDKAIFEIILYRLFIVYNNSKYNYIPIDIVEELKNTIGENKFKKMIKKMHKKNQDMLPYFIHGWEVLRIRDIFLWGKIYRKYKIFSARLYLVDYVLHNSVTYFFIKCTGIKIACATDGINKKNKIHSYSLIKKLQMNIKCLIKIFFNCKNRGK